MFGSTRCGCKLVGVRANDMVLATMEQPLTMLMAKQLMENSTRQPLHMGKTTEKITTGSTFFTNYKTNLGQHST